MNSSISSRTGKAAVLTRFLWLVVWAGLFLYLGFTLWLGLAGLTYPYQLDYGEGIVLWFARQIYHGQAIYKGLTGMPYASSNYPPLFMLLAAWLMPVFGEGYTGGRLLNLVSALVVAGLVYQMVRVEWQWKRPIFGLTGGQAGALAALLFLGSPYVYHWVPFFRTDLTGLALALGGVFAVWAWERRIAVTPRQSAGAPASNERAGPTHLNEGSASGAASAFPAWPFLAVALALFLLALYTKHTLLAAPVAAFLAIARRSKKLAIAFALGLGLFGGTVYVAMDRATNGGFAFGLITSNATVFLPGQLASLLVDFVKTYAILILLAIWGLVRHLRSQSWGMLDWYLVTSFAALVMAGRVGAWENYFFEAIAAACILGIGALLSTIGFLSNLGFPSAQGAAWVPVLLPALLLAQIGLMGHDPRAATELMAQDAPANRELAALVERTPGILISEDMGALVTSGRGVAYYTFQYSSLARSGQWDQHWELNGLSEGAFPLVILDEGTRQDVDHFRRFTREFVSALDRYYAHVETLGKFDVYRPAPLEHMQSAEFGGSLAMVGWSLQPGSLQAGPMQLTVVWQAQKPLDRRYTAFAHLENAAGEVVTQDDHEPQRAYYPTTEPQRGYYPTTRWGPNEMVRDVYTLNVSAGLPPGPYTLRVGWYDTETKDRLTVEKSPDDTVVLSRFERGKSE